MSTLTSALPLSIPLAGELVRGTLLCRRDRFLAEVRLDSGNMVEAHCVNPGRMEAFVEEGATVWLSTATGEKSTKRRY
eukprot:6209735-Pleurochrysis_carterae.AAC.2